MSEALDDLAGAYVGVDSLDSFPDRRSLENYRQSLLARSAPQADFISEHLPGPATLLEVACGNGRLMIELAARGILSRGLGLDIADSRIRFARRWAADLRQESLSFETGDALEADLEESFDAVACITGAFGYFEPLAPGNALKLGRKLHDALAPRGLLCLELYPSSRYRRLAEAGGGDVRVWSELPAEDPWRYYLSHLQLDGSVLTHHKTFIHRDTGEVDSGRTERLYLYSQRDIAAILQQVGFEDPRAWQGWTGEPYRDDESMVVTARRPES